MPPDMNGLRTSKKCVMEVKTKAHRNKNSNKNKTPQIGFMSKESFKLIHLFRMVISVNFNIHFRPLALFHSQVSESFYRNLQASSF